MRKMKIVAAALGVGGLAGGLVPLPDRVEASEVRVTPDRSRQSAPPGLAGKIEVPEQITTAWAAGCAKSRPDEFFRWLVKADPQPDLEIVAAFFQEWIRRDPDSAYRAALSLPGRFGFRENRFFVLELQELFKRDPLAALRWCGRIEGIIGDGPVMNHSKDVAEKQFPRLDPEEVRSLLNRARVGSATVWMADAYAQWLADSDPRAAIRWGESLNVEFQTTILPMVFLRWAEQDPKAAMEYIRNAPSHIRQYAALFAMPAGSAAEIFTGMKWLEQEMGISSYAGINNLMGRLYGKDEKAAQDYVVSLEPGGQREAAVRGLAEAACGRPETVLSLVVNLPDELQLEATNSAFLTRMPGWYPDFLKPLADGSVSEANMENYIHQLAIFLDGETGTSFARKTVTWKITDMPEVLGQTQDWLKDNPGPNRDRFIRDAHGVLKENPELRDRVFEKIPADELKRILEN
ncbi:hypothetical protein JIN84_21220 [Luteolibacter yonseiensis]|uniref:Uncharacterized protein n=1 Tax=Luteolibacter yonseiensis TaxID=1144680 RepID=A0A934R924_9BACT|nr:hypothetical protein [Luteolibacter yonseiensis]MBK1818158.1 hypothetical protein [Luteolibacter yonseiensis]